MFDNNSANFFEMWSKSKENIETALRSYGSIDDFDSAFDTEIEQWLMLLKLLPLRQHGKTTSRHRLNFQQAIDKFIVFCQVSCTLMNIKVAI